MFAPQRLERAAGHERGEHFEHGCCWPAGIIRAAAPGFDHLPPSISGSERMTLTFIFFLLIFYYLSYLCRPGAWLSSVCDLISAHRSLSRGPSFPLNSPPFDSKIQNLPQMGCGGSRPEVIEGEDALGAPRPRPVQLGRSPIPPAPDGVATAPEPRPRRQDERVNSDKQANQLVSMQRWVSYALVSTTPFVLCWLTPTFSPAICLPTG